MNDIDKLAEALLLVISAGEETEKVLEALEAKNDELETRVEDLGLRLRKLEAAKPPMFYPQYSPNEWPQPTKWAYPEYPTIKWNTTCGIKNADSN